MKPLMYIIASAAIVLTGCASDGANVAEPTASTAAIGQARNDLDEARSLGGEWKLIDQATGNDAQDLSVLLKLAEKKASEGELQEAERLAKRVSTFARLGAEQSRLYAGAMPSYE